MVIHGIADLYVHEQSSRNKRPFIAAAILPRLANRRGKKLFSEKGLKGRFDQFRQRMICFGIRTMNDDFLAFHDTPPGSIV